MSSTRDAPASRSVSLVMGDTSSPACTQPRVISLSPYRSTSRQGSPQIQVRKYLCYKCFLLNGLTNPHFKSTLIFIFYYVLNVSSPVSLRWRLHFEFITAREPVEAPVVLQNQSEVTVWTGAENVDVDTFSWDLPIKVLPTNPTLASYVSQFTGTNSITI